MIGLGEPRRSSSRRRRRHLLRRDGPSPRARPSHRTPKTTVPTLPASSFSRIVSGRPLFKKDPSVIGKTVRLGSGSGDRSATDHRRPRALRPLSPGHRDHRQRRHQPAPSLRHHGHRPHPSHDRALRPSRSRRHSRSGSRRVALRLRGHDEGPSRSLFAQSATSRSGRSCFATRSPRTPGPCCWCCSRPRRWSSSSRAPTSPT